MRWQSEICRFDNVVLRFALVSVGSLLFVFSGCTSTQESHTPRSEKLQRHNWWNYYHRGVARMADGNLSDAQEDFERCLGLRPTKKFPFAVDRWLVRTYGMHFLEAYFPHRELGICLYFSGYLNESLVYLEKSMDQAPSGRAKHYLNLVRSRLLAGIQISPPEIHLDRTSLQRWTRDRTRRIAGVASGKGFVREIVIDGNRQFIELAEQKIAFDEEVALSPGTNLIVVKVQDLTGKEAVAEVRCIADWNPPQFVVQRLDKTTTGWKVEGSCVDDFGIQKISAGRDVLYLASGEDQQTDVSARFVLESNEEKQLVAQDMAGNPLYVTVSGSDLAALISAQSISFYASAESGVSDVRERTTYIPPDRQEEEDDRTNPFLRVSGNRKPQVVFNEEHFIDGQADDHGGLASLRINGEEFLPDEKRGVIQSYFSRRLHLDVGTNVFEVVARDLAGNRMSQDLTVVRRVPEHLSMKYRLHVALPPFSEEGPQGLARRIRGQLESELLIEPPRFRVLERDEAGWNAILREVTVSGSGMADPRAARILRRMLPAEYLFLGTIQSFGKGTTVYVRIVDPATSEIVHRADVYTESIQEDLVRQLSGLAMKIENYFPLVGGRVVDVQGKNAVLNVGDDEGVHENVRFVVASGKEKKVEGFLGGVHVWRGRFVQLGVDEVERNRCRTKILPSKAKRIVQEGDYVYAR